MTTKLAISIACLLLTVTQAIFAQAILDGGEHNGQRIISPHTLKFMNRDYLDGDQTFLPGTTMGLGFGIVEDPAQLGYPLSEGTLFWGGAAATAFWIDPLERFVVVNMTQHMGVPATESLRSDLAALVYSALIN